MPPRANSLFILAGAAALQLCQPLSAADLPSVKAPPAAPPPAFTWTGLYVGAELGYTWSSSRSINAASANILDQALLGWGPASALSASGVVSSNLDGFLSGGGLGYNWQFADQWVAGLEADLQGAGVRGGGGLSNFVPNPNPIFAGLFAVTGAKLDRNLEYLATVRGGSATARDQTVGTDLSFIDFLTKSSSFPLSFSGRFDASNGPVSFYGDLIWMQLRFSGSTLQLRSPFADVLVAANADAHMKQTMAIGEAGGAYELARWKFTGAPSSFTALDAYAGLRYWYVSVDLQLDAIGAASSQAICSGSTR